MIWTAWNNGKHLASGAGYGFRVPLEDRRRHFRKSWSTVILRLPRRGRTETVTVNVKKKSFWTPTCGELASKVIGRWLIDMGLAPWPTRRPPKLNVVEIGEGQFRVRLQIKGSRRRGLDKLEAKWRRNSK